MCRGLVTTNAIVRAMSSAVIRSTPGEPGRHRLPDLRPVVARQLRRDRAGLDQAHPHEPLRDLHPQGLGERPDRELAGVVGAAALAHPPARDAAGDHEVGDPARLPLRRREQVRQRGVRGVHRAQRVELDHPAPLARVRVDERAQEHHSGVRHHRVQPAEPLDGGGDRRAGLILVGDVRLDRQRATAGFVDPFRPGHRGGRRGGRRRPRPRRARPGWRRSARRCRCWRRSRARRCRPVGRPEGSPFAHPPRRGGSGTCRTGECGSRSWDPPTPGPAASRCSSPTSRTG